MNKIIIALMSVIILGSFTSHAQLINVAATADSTVVVDKVYAGMLAATSYLCDKDTTKVSTAFRVGAAAHWDIGKKLTLKSFTASEHEFVSSSSFGMDALWMQYRPTNKWAVEVGRGPTLAAQQHRPHPVSQSGQFETWTQAQLSGIAYSVNLKYMPSADLLFGGGLSLSDNMPEYQVTANYKLWLVTGFHQSATNTSGIALTYNGTRFYNTSFVKSDAVGSFSSWQISAKRPFYLFTDFGYSTTSHSIVRWGSGAFASFTMGKVKSIFAIAYNHEVKGITGYLFVSL